MTHITSQQGQGVEFKSFELFRVSLVTTTMQPLWKPAQPHSQQRHLITSDLFFLFVPRAM
jgi:hypothetical protein